MRLVRLDGLRGVAALAVLVLHYFSEAGGVRLFRHGYLAVDFFFLLSGFVIAYTYEARLADGLSLLRFARARAVRLYPLAVAAVLAVAALRTAYPHPALPDAAFLRHVVLNALLLPDLVAPPPDWFPLVAPSWSLFYELAVNLTYAALLPWLGSRVLVTVLIGSACLLAAFAVESGSVQLLHENLVAGFARTVFSFVLGVWVFRHREAVSRPFAGLPSVASYALVLAVLAAPAMPGAEWPFDLAVIGLVMPCALALALQQTAQEGRDGVELLLGELSYPLYLLHMPVALYVGVGLGWAMTGTALAVAATAATLFASLLASRLYDRPVRRWLGTRTSRPLPQSPARAEP